MIVYAGVQNGRKHICKISQQETVNIVEGGLENEYE